MTTQLKDHRYDFPLPKLGEKKRKAAKVELTDNGYFKVYFPKEVIAMFGLKPDGHAYGTTLNEAVRSFEFKIEDYKNAIQTQDRKRVIVVRFLFNQPYKVGFGHHTQLARTDHGHWNNNAGQYGLALDYEVLWQIGEKIYEVPIQEDNGRIYGPPTYRYSLPFNDRAYNVMDWTEERDQFLFAMVNRLDGLVDQLRAFFGKNMLENMTMAIENGGVMPALPAPEGG
jgi:hypothetical protein